MPSPSAVQPIDTQKRITAVVPIRITDANRYLLQRLDFILLDPTALHHVDVMVVDDGSSPNWAHQIAEKCKERGYQYERLKTANRIFSIGRARNHAAQVSSTRFIFFIDADLIPPPGFFRRLDDEVRDRQLPARAEDFIMIPVSYLSEAATEDYLHNSGPNRYGEFLDSTIDRNPSVVEKFSTGTSACLYTRLYYLARGGNIEDFSGWGYEDLEFNLRMARLTRIFPYPADYTKDQFSFDKQYEYKGWKAIYRLFGDRSFLKGLMLFHAWHPIETDTAYYKQRAANKVQFDQAIAAFAKSGAEPEALYDKHHGRSLLLKQTPFTSERLLRPMLGEILSADAETLPSNEYIGEMLAARAINRIVFQNPYGSPETRRIYDWARSNGFPFIICERGALPNTILFDRTGFLADSSMFAPQHWDRELTTQEESELYNYLQSETGPTATTLETQATARLQPSQLRETLGITTADRLILLCLQRPTDTATQFFPGLLGTYTDFVWIIEKLSQSLPSNVKIAFKVHPLENNIPNIRGIDVSAFHIHDLMAVADKMVTFTSGTGVIGMQWNLPIVTCGNAFYSQPSLIHSPTSEIELRDMICGALSANEVAYRKFLHYLRFRYYSVGSFSTRAVTMPDGTRMTATTSIRFQTIRGFGNFDLEFANRSSPLDSRKSMLFDRYMGARENAVATKGRPPSAPAKNRPHSRPSHADWSPGRRALHWVSRQTIGHFQTADDRHRLANNPIDFFQKAKWGPNRFFGRILLDKSQRPY